MDQKKGGAAALLSTMPEWLAQILVAQVANLERGEPAKTPIEADRVFKAVGSAARSSKLIVDLERLLEKTIASMVETEALVRAVTKEATDMDDDGNPTTPDELAEFQRRLRDNFRGTSVAPEQKSAGGNRADRKRREALAKRMGRSGAPGATRA